MHANRAKRDGGDAIVPSVPPLTQKKTESLASPPRPVRTSALLTESHCSRSVIVILTVAGPREGRWWMITIPDLTEIRGL